MATTCPTEHRHSRAAHRGSTRRPQHRSVSTRPDDQHARSSARHLFLENLYRFWVLRALPRRARRDCSTHSSRSPRSSSHTQALTCPRQSRRQSTRRHESTAPVHSTTIDIVTHVAIDTGSLTPLAALRRPSSPFLALSPASGSPTARTDDHLPPHSAPPFDLRSPSERCRAPVTPSREHPREPRRLPRLRR